MKRVLMVSEKFPPFNVSGSARPFYFAKYLPEHGYAPTVICATLRRGEERDDELLSQLPEDVRVLRSPRVVPPIFAKLLARAEGDAGTTRLGGSLEGASRAGARGSDGLWARLEGGTRYLRWWLHWEIDWGVSATLAGALGSRLDPPRLVWVSGPHFRTYETGRRLARWLRVPLVVDMRDPWTYGSLWRPRTARIAQAERARAARTLSAAARVIFTSPLTQQAMSQRFPELSAARWLTITNGYEDEAAEPLRGFPEQRCLFRYIGALNERRTPDVLIEAFRLAAEDPEFRERATLEFIGNARGHETKAALAPGCDVHFRGHVSRADSLRYMFGSDVNILLQTIGEGQDVVSGKAFDYLHAGKPILAVVDESGGDAWLIRQTGAGLLAPWTDPAAIARAMRRAFEGFRSGVPAARPSLDVLQQYSRRALTARLAAVFDEVLAERG